MGRDSLFREESEIRPEHAEESRQGGAVDSLTIERGDCALSEGVAHQFAELELEEVGPHPLMARRLQAEARGIAFVSRHGMAHYNPVSQIHTRSEE